MVGGPHLYIIRGSRGQLNCKEKEKGYSKRRKEGRSSYCSGPRSRIGESSASKSDLERIKKVTKLGPHLTLEVGLATEIRE